MISDATSTTLFATWTTEFDVQVNPATQHLTFAPLRSADGSLGQRNLFARSGKSERHFQRLISEFLALRPDTPVERWTEVARLLGPLFAQHPINHAALRKTIEEPIHLWLQAQDDLRDLWADLKDLKDASNQPLSEEEQRESALHRMAAADLLPPLELMPEAERERLIEAFAPASTDTEAMTRLDRIGRRLNRYFMDGHPPLSPLINPSTLEAEVVVSQGIQALFLMSAALSRQDAQSFPTRCAHRHCTTVAFMKGRKRYCSKTCQEADKSMRYRRRQRNG